MINGTAANAAIKVAAAADVGKAINPMTVEQQIEGGVVMGLSNGILEGFSFRDGRIENVTENASRGLGIQLWL